RQRFPSRPFHAFACFDDRCAGYHNGAETFGIRANHLNVDVVLPFILDVDEEFVTGGPSLLGLVGLRIRSDQLHVYAPVRLVARLGQTI
ncbi:hypothetical protein, partial [Salmonella sp. SAL4443]|uniref:hypothetical protein n=1 Tax=Salmonella sp. SAL4443 TaxID=3159898 RepID=UPI00397B37F7